jgi:NAD(P)-dependent dehydrogenase (short-subunit alcohol dehydrogenase family)
MNNCPNFKDKVALVTGASSGMGLATAQAFAEAGASVTLADVKEEAVREAVEKMVSEGHRARHPLRRRQRRSGRSWSSNGGRVRQTGRGL